MITATSNIHFTSRIKLVTLQQFKEEHERLSSEKLEQAGYPWDINNAIICKNGATGGIECCTVMGLIRKTGNNTQNPLFMMHVDPNKQNIKAVKEKLPTTINYFLKNVKKAQAFILGGDPSFPLNKELFESVKSVIHKAGLKCSFIWGQKGTFAQAMYSSDCDTWFINISDMNGKEVLTKKQLLKSFDIIDICDRDHLEFPNEKALKTQAG